MRQGFSSGGRPGYPSAICVSRPMHRVRSSAKGEGHENSTARDLAIRSPFARRSRLSTGPAFQPERNECDVHEDGG